MARVPKRKILELLKQNYFDTTTALQFTSTFELLIAVILSAQCTDERVNKVTATLFPRYNTPEAMLELDQAGLEAYIKGCGLFHTKAANILKTSRILVEQYNGQVPGAFDELVALPGVGRKTANVMLSNAFGQPAIAVDTHVFRVANRLGLADSNTTLGTEQDLMQAIPKKDWSDAHHWLIWHGRKICHARKPACEQCMLAEHCRFRREDKAESKQNLFE